MILLRSFPAYIAVSVAAVEGRGPTLWTWSWSCWNGTTGQCYFNRGGEDTFPRKERVSSNPVVLPLLQLVELQPCLGWTRARGPAPRWSPPVEMGKYLQLSRLHSCRSRYMGKNCWHIVGCEIHGASNCSRWRENIYKTKTSRRKSFWKRVESCFSLTSLTEEGQDLPQCFPICSAAWMSWSTSAQAVVSVTILQLYESCLYHSRYGARTDPCSLQKYVRAE